MLKRIPVLLVLILILVLAFPSTVSAQERPIIFLWPQGGIVGGTVLLRGSGFPQMENVQIFFGGHQVSSAFTGNGYDFEASFQIPPTIGGYKTVEIRKADGGVMAKTSFYVEPQRLFVSPSQGTIGSTIAVWGSGFLPGNTVLIQLGNKVVASTMGDANGYFQKSVVIPMTILPGWRYTLEAFGGGVKAFASIEVLQPIVTLSSYSVNPGDMVTVLVWGALPFMPVNIFIGEREITPYPAPLVGRDGSVWFEVTIPELPWGGYSLKVRSGSLWGSQLITVLQESPFKVERVLSPISNEVIIVLGYDRGQWKFYDPAAPTQSDLKEFGSGKAYWIKVKNDCVLMGANNQVYQLFKDWNLIGW